MGQSAAFIEDNLSRLKQNLVATIVIIVNDQGPIFIYLLVNIDNRANNMSFQTILMAIKHSAAVINPYAIDIGRQ
jgi:hypothetical protein